MYIVAGGMIFTVFSCGVCTLTTISRIIYSMAEVRSRSYFFASKFAVIRKVDDVTQILIMSYITAKNCVWKYTQSRRSRVVYMKQIHQRSEAEWCMLCIHIVCKQ